MGNIDCRCFYSAWQKKQHGAWRHQVSLRHPVLAGVRTRSTLVTTWPYRGSERKGNAFKTGICSYSLIYS